MIIYEVFCKDYEHRKGGILGMLVERRKDLKGMTQFESGMRWAKIAFSGLVKYKETIFIVPNELKYAER